MWKLILKALRTPKLFTDPILTVIDNKLKVNINSVKLLATVFLFRYENALAQVATDPTLLSSATRRKFELNANKIRLFITMVYQHMPFRCCSDSGACKKHVSKGDAVPKYSRGVAFVRGCPQWTLTAAGDVFYPRRRFVARGK